MPILPIGGPVTSDALPTGEHHDRAIMRGIVHQIAKAARGIGPLGTVAHIGPDGKPELGAPQVCPQRALPCRIGGAADRIAGVMPVAVSGTGWAAAGNGVVHAAGTARIGVATGIGIGGLTVATGVGAGIVRRCVAAGIAAGLLLVVSWIRRGAIAAVVLVVPRIDL